jgi:hypothetical protein
VLVRTGRGAAEALRLPGAGLAEAPQVADLAEAVDRWLAGLRLPRTKTPPAEGGAEAAPEILP